MIFSENRFTLFGIMPSANAPLSRDFVVRTPRCARLPVFLPSPEERDGAPEGAQGALRSAPLGQPCDRPACTPSFRDPSRLRAVGVPWRAGLLRGSPGASRRSIADRVVGGRTLRSHQASRSTTPLIEQGGRTVGQTGETAKSNTPVCKL